MNAVGVDKHVLYVAECLLVTFKTTNQLIRSKENLQVKFQHQ